MKSKGCPIVGDKLYSTGRNFSKKISKKINNLIVGFERQALHSKKIIFKHPIKNTPLELIAKKPHDFLNLEKVFIHETANLAESAEVSEGTKIWMNVQVRENVKIGKNCMIAGQVGFAGSSTIGNNVSIGGQAGISGHLSIGNNVKIGGGSGVVKDIEDNTVVMGYPAVPLKDFLKK